MFQNWGSCLVGKDQVAQLSCILPLFQNLIGASLLFVGTVGLFMMIYGGIKFIWSRGDPKQIEGARHTITWGIIGLVVVLLSFMLIRLIGFVTKTGDIITKFGFPTP